MGTHWADSRSSRRATQRRILQWPTRRYLILKPTPPSHLPLQLQTRLVFLTRRRSISH